METQQVSTRLFADIIDAPCVTNQNTCQYCGAKFSSRNAIFRHLRSTSNDCYNIAINGGSVGSLKKRKVAIQFGYYHDSNTDSNKDSNKDDTLQKESIANLVISAFSQAMNSMHPIEITGTSSTATKSLASPDCSACSDTLAINYKSGNNDVNTIQLVSKMRDIVAAQTGEHVLEILGLEQLSVSTKFHAEQSCTQRTYQYLLPLHWLNDGDKAEEWAKKISSQEDAHQKKSSTSSTPLAISRLKEALKHAESKDTSNEAPHDDNTSSIVVSSPGRFGSLGQKERRCWHNFCDPHLKAAATPSHKSVWGTVDRARVAEFQMHNGTAFAVVELRGDRFVAIPRIMACIVAMTNDWLPSHYFELVTRPNVSIETPIAPPSNRLYFHSARFHFIEMVRGSSLFATKWEREKRSTWLATLQTRMLETIDPVEESDWLNELRDVTAPRICSRLAEIVVEDGRVQSQKKALRIKQPVILSIEQYSEPPVIYDKTLSLLKEISSASKWPSTPVSRSRVIRSAGQPTVCWTGSATSSFTGKSTQTGSFTVVNPSIMTTDSGRNELFPDLVKSIFELERILAKEVARHDQAERPSSTHCAVNRNAEFTPHTDNGRGHGLSMMVAMGDFKGGGLTVDGETNSVRYSPLEYDGWKQSHSTDSFEGERFSLTWFTPDRSHVRERDADDRAQFMVKVHEKKLPSYPMLQFRRKSTDALVINEILDPSGNRCAYEQRGFSLCGHKCVLDIGAHIGVFTRYVLALGCERVIAYEPECHNLELLERNTKPTITTNITKQQQVEIHAMAVAHGRGEMKSFIHATTRNDGTLNTWRHSLEKYSTYAETIQSGEGALARSQVQTIPFFGEGGALQEGITAVKLDCEGAELDILLSAEAAQYTSWLDVTHLVFEWSFTKERRVEQFHRAVDNLKNARFSLTYEGQGAWWDTEQDVMWPYHSDLVVYAVRKQIHSCGPIETLSNANL